MELTIDILGYALVAVAVAMLPFSVSLFSSAYRCINWNESFVISLFFGFSQAFLMVLGWFIGFALSGLFNGLAYPVASLVFLFSGMKLLSDARRAASDRRVYSVKDIRMLAGFSLAVSINAFMVGTALGLIGTTLLLNALLQLLVTFGIVLLGIWLGKKGAYRTAMRAEVAGAVLFFILALAMVGLYLKIL